MGGKQANQNCQQRRYHAHPLHRNSSLKLGSGVACLLQAGPETSPGELYHSALAIHTDDIFQSASDSAGNLTLQVPGVSYAGCNLQCSYRIIFSTENIHYDLCAEGSCYYASAYTDRLAFAVRKN